MKTAPRVYTADRKISGSRLHSLGYTHLNPRYDYRIAVLPDHPGQKLLLTYRYKSMEERYDLSVVDSSLNHLSGPLICLGPDTALYTQWFPGLIREAAKNMKKEKMKGGADCVSLF